MNVNAMQTNIFNVCVVVVRDAPVSLTSFSFFYDYLLPSSAQFIYAHFNVVADSVFTSYIVHAFMYNMHLLILSDTITIIFPKIILFLSVAFYCSLPAINTHQCYAFCLWFFFLSTRMLYCIYNVRITMTSLCV